MPGPVHHVGVHEVLYHVLAPCWDMVHPGEVCAHAQGSLWAHLGPGGVGRDCPGPHRGPGLVAADLVPQGIDAGRHIIILII